MLANRMVTISANVEATCPVTHAGFHHGDEVIEIFDN